MEFCKALIFVIAISQSPCTDRSSFIGSPVGIDTISLFKCPCRPLTKLSITNILTIALGSSGVTIVGNHLEPYLRNSITLVSINFKALPFNGSCGCTRLSYEVTRSTTDTGILPLYLNEVIAGWDSDRCTHLLATTPTPTHVDVDAASF